MSKTNQNPDVPAPISYDEWLALGPEKAAEYTAARMGCNEDRKRKLVLILQALWNETRPNAKVSEVAGRKE